MKKALVVLFGCLFFSSSLSAASKTKVEPNAVREEAISKIEDFSKRMESIDPDFKQKEERLALIVPTLKKRYKPSLWSDRFKFIYFALTESDRADQKISASHRYKGKTIDQKELLKLYLEDEQKLAGDSSKLALEERKLAADKRLNEIEFLKNAGKYGLVESIGREYAVITIYYPDAERLHQLMKDRINLLSNLNRGEISRGQFEIMLFNQYKQFLSEG